MASPTADPMEPSGTVDCSATAGIGISWLHDVETGCFRVAGTGMIDELPMIHGCMHSFDDDHIGLSRADRCNKRWTYTDGALYAFCCASCKLDWHTAGTV